MIHHVVYADICGPVGGGADAAAAQGGPGLRLHRHPHQVFDHRFIILFDHRLTILFDHRLTIFVSSEIDDIDIRPVLYPYLAHN
jgi:hypothetical protein